MVMTKRFSVIACIAVLLCFVACEHDPYRVRVQGHLYTDSTCTAPIANDTIRFYHAHEFSPFGLSVTDTSGAFAFSFWSNDADNWDETYQSKFQFHDYDQYLVLYKKDTLWSSGSSSYDLKLYPGCYINGYYYYE